MHMVYSLGVDNKDFYFNVKMMELRLSKAEKKIKMTEST